MPLKLKHNYSNKSWLKGIFVTVFLVFYFIFSSGVVSAAGQTFQIDDIGVTLDVAIGTSAGNMQKANYIRLGKNQTLYIAGIIVLQKAGSVGQLTFNQDEIYFEGGATLSREIQDFGVGLEQAETSSGGGIKCGSEAKGGTRYPTCDFPFGLKSGHQAQTVNLGEILFRNTNDPLKLDASNSNIKGINQTAGSDGKIGSFYFVVYPFLTYNGWSGSNPVVLTGTQGGKTIQVDIYDTQDNATKANQTQGTPSGVAAYGSTTATGQSSDEGSTLLGLLNKVVAFLLGLINEALFFVFYWFIAPLIQAVLSIHPYTDVFVSVIYPGWEVIRNVCNIFFIIALIIIAMGTLLRLEAYQFRHLLVQLILAALLVNFSLVVGQAVLGLADTVQSQFLPNNAEVIRSLARDLMVSNTRDIVWSTDVTSNGYFSTTVSLLFYTALATGSFCVFLAIAVFLLIRIVALWIYLMISPIAYAAGALPATTKYRAEWWGGFLKYAFFTPIMAFFLNLTAIISKTVPDVLGKISDGSFTASTSPSLSNFLFKVASNVTLLIFLIAALKVAESFSIVGASTITGLAKKGIFAPFAVAKVGAERAFEGLQNVTGVTMDPRQWAAKWKDYSEREKHKRLEKRADQEVGLPGLRIPGSAKIGLGSPMDFYKNYANWQAVKRMGRNLRKRTKTAFDEMEHAKDHLDDLKQQGNILTDNDFAELEAKHNDAKADYNSKLNEAKTLTDEKNKFKQELKVLEGKEETSGVTEDEKKRMAALRAKIVERDRGLKELGATKFVEDAAGNETLIEDFAQGTILKEAQVLEKDLDGQIASDNEKLNSLRAKKGNPSLARQTQAERDALTKEIREAGENYKKAQQAYFGRRLPEAYHARAARQSLESEEEKKVSDIKNWPEKVQVFLTAQAEDNPYLAAATLKSLAKDSNFNEIVEALGYSSSAEGLKQLFETEFRDKFGLTDHQMMQVATEVGYVNEDAGWWNMARISDINKHGHLDWSIDTDLDGKWANYLRTKLGRDVTEDDLKNYKADITTKIAGTDETEYDLKWSPQNNEVKVEMEKRGPRVIANFARTSFVNQTLGPEGHMSTSIHKAGKELMQSMSKTQNTIYEFARMLRPNTAKAISGAPEWSWDYCQRNRIDRAIYETITKMAGKPVEPLV